MKSQPEIRATLRAHVRDVTDAADAAVNDDTPLFRSGLLKSVHVMELILLVEELSGRPVDVEKLKPGAFESVDAIWKGFFP